MNNVYSSNSIMCYENKAMTAAPSERQIPQPVCLNLEIDKEQQPESRKSRFLLKTYRLRRTHILNLVITVLVSSLILLLEYGVIPGTKVGFRCNDPVISHPYRGDTISPTILLVGSTLLPIVVIIIVEALIKESFKAIKIKDVWFYYKECLIGVVFVFLITEIVKIIVGEHRPHFIDVCKPDTSLNCLDNTYVETYTCTNSAYSGYFVIDSSRSFPSGHSSISTFVALYCGFVVHRRLPTHHTGRLFKPLFVAICLTWGLLCSLTRIVDRRHHWWDVLAGMTLGVCGAIYTIHLVKRKMEEVDEKMTLASTSTTTLLDVKNKGASSFVI